jgi:hypothetical protein
VRALLAGLCFTSLAWGLVAACGHTDGSGPGEDATPGDGATDDATLSLDAGGRDAAPAGDDAGARDAAIARDGAPGARVDGHGTWVLGLSEGDMPGIAKAFAQETPDLVGVSVRLAWSALVTTDGGAPDFSVLDRWRAFVAGLRDGGPPVQLAVRFIAGVHTPWAAYPDLASSEVNVVDPDGGDAGFVPSPCLEDGGPNTVFEHHYLEFMAALDAWARSAGVSIVHLPWYGREWSEMYTGPEVLAACHDTLPDGGVGPAAGTHLVNAYDHLFDVAYHQAGSDGVTIEYPLSGQGGVVPYANAVEKHLQDVAVGDGGAGHLFVQSQAWGLDGSNKVPLGGAYWSCLPIPHGFQAAQVDTCSIDGGPATDWRAMYDSVRTCSGVFTEVYLESFQCTDPSSAQLGAQVTQFAADLPPYSSCDGG